MTQDIETFSKHPEMLTFICHSLSESAKASSMNYASDNTCYVILFVSFMEHLC